MRGEDGLIGLGEADLADRGGGLALLKRELAFGEAQRPAAERDRAGGDEDHVLGPAAEVGDVGGEAFEPAEAEPVGLGVDQERRADLDDDAAGGLRGAPPRSGPP